MVQNYYMQFSQCVGQEVISNRMIQSVKSGRIHHAHLLLGQPGGSGLAMAFAFAQYVNCTNKSDFDSCGTCNSCKKMMKHIHPDVVYSFPSVKEKGAKSPPISKDYLTQFRSFITDQPFAEEKDWLASIDSGNRQGNITALECLEIIKSVKLKRVEGAYRFIIIWKAEQLAKEGNRLLKIIEEPPENTIFILVAEEEERILNTILSRCQITRLAPISQEKAKEYLLKNGFSEEVSNRAALLADGNLGRAVEIAQENISEEHLLSEWLACIIKDKSNIQTFTEKMSQLSKEVIKNIFLHGTQLCRESLILQETDLVSRLPESEEKIARWLGKRLTVFDIHQLSEVFEKAHYAMQRNANVKLLLMSLSLSIDEIIMQREFSKN